jgi:hypothetical protein
MIIEVVEAMGLEVTYAYEDLVFISYNAFLLRMGRQGERVHLYFNEESDPAGRPKITEQLTEAASSRSLEIVNSGTYTMNPRPDKHLDIHFNETIS